MLLFVPDHGATEFVWLESLPGRPATVRGRLRRSRRRRPVLVVDAAGTPVSGRLVELGPEQVALLDIVEGVGTGGLARVPVRAVMSLRTVEAQAYVDTNRRGRRV